MRRYIEKIAYTPHALPMFREPMPGTKEIGMKGIRKDLVASKKPLPPVHGGRAAPTAPA